MHVRFDWKSNDQSNSWAICSLDKRMEKKLTKLFNHMRRFSIRNEEKEKRNHFVSMSCACAMLILNNDLYMWMCVYECLYVICLNNTVFMYSLLPKPDYYIQKLQCSVPYYCLHLVTCEMQTLCIVAST